MHSHFTHGPLFLSASFLAFIPVAVRLLFARLFTFETNLLINAQCASSTSSPYSLEYTGIPSLDEALCYFVSFFHASLGPDEFNAFTLLLINLCTMIFVMFVESGRSKPPKVISIPTVWGLVIQTITMAMTLPVYWLSFLLGAGHRLPPSHSSITQERAEATVFGFLAGCIVPSLGLVIFKDPQVTAIWQFFPLYVYLATTLHHFVRPSKPDSSSGHRMIQMAYIAIFIFASSYHSSLIWPLLGDWTAFQALLLPIFRNNFFPSDASLAFRTLDFFKADIFISMASSLLATLWFATSFGQLFILISWVLLGSVFVGPAATICAVMYWREFHLELSQNPAKGSS